MMQPLWFQGASCPPANTDCEDNSDEVDFISDDEVWSEESDEEVEN